MSAHGGVKAINASNLLQVAMSGTADFLGMQWMGGVDCASRMSFTSGPNEGHDIIAADFGEKLAEGRNLIGIPVFG